MQLRQETSVFFFSQSGRSRGFENFKLVVLGVQFAPKPPKLSVLDLRWMHVASIGPPGDAPNGKVKQNPLPFFPLPAAPRKIFGISPSYSFFPKGISSNSASAKR